MNGSGYVCVVGGANIDIEGRASGAVQPGDSNPGTVVQTAGGVGRNIAANLALLGAEVALITALGADDAGTLVSDETTAAGVNLNHAVTVAGPTSSYLSVLDEQGEMVVAINDMAALDAIDTVAITDRAELLTGASAIVAECNLAAAALATLAAAAPGPLFVDTVSDHKAHRCAAVLDQIHLLKPNRSEAALLTGTVVDDVASTVRAAQQLVALGVDRAVISMGAEGIAFADRVSCGVVDALDVEVRSVTGAGDAMMAALVHAHLSGVDFRSAVSHAAAAAAIAVQSTTTVADGMSAEAIAQLVS